eukprot:1534703-Amphidinium_carterae.1
MCPHSMCGIYQDKKKPGITPDPTRYPNLLLPFNDFALTRPRPNSARCQTYLAELLAISCV